MPGARALLDTQLERPWTSSHPSPAQSLLPRSASRQRSMNDLVLAWRDGPPSASSSRLSVFASNETDDSDTLTSLPQIPDTYPRFAGYETISHAPARPTARHSFSSAITSSLEGIRQAAGRRLKNKTRFGRKSAGEEDAKEHTASGPAWLRGRASTLLRGKRPSELAPITVDTSKDLSSRQSPLDSQATLQHISPITFGPAAGQGARAAAALAREKLKNVDVARSPSRERSTSLRRLSISSRESGILFKFSTQSDETLVPKSETCRQDPAGLPTEIFSKVLSHLDSESLMKAELVSRRWNDVAKSHHVWKYAFNQEFTEPARSKSGISGEISAGGFGLDFKHGYQPWKRMWQVRKQLDQRWRDGHAAAIYLIGHHDSVYCVQFDEDKIITGSRDWTIRVWDARTLRCTHVLGVPKGVNTTLQPLSRRKEEGKQPVACIFPPESTDEPVRVQSSARHTGSVLSIDYDDDLMVSGSSDCTVIVWSIAGGRYKALKQLRQHTMGVLDVRLNKKYIVACSKDTTVTVWDRHTLSLVRVLNGHRGPVNAVQLRDDFVVSASGDGVAKLWNLTNGLCVKEFHPPGDENVGRVRGLACVEFTHDTKTIFAGGNDQKVYQFDTASGNMVRTFTGHEALVRSLHYDAANGRIVTGSYDHAVWTYDFETGKPLCNFKDWTTSWMLSAKADYRRIVAASQDGKAIVMDFGYGLPGVELLASTSRPS